MEKVLVCLKQVPNTKDIKIDPENHTLIRENVESVINPCDDYALEQALKLKRKYGIKVATMTMGPPQAESILEYSLRRGADESFLLSDTRLAGSDTWATSIAIAALIKKTGYKSVFCGQESVDSGTGHIGASIAELLNIPLINYTREIETLENGKLQILAKYDTADALMEVVTPLVISFLKQDRELTPLIEEIADREKIWKMSIDDLKLDPAYVGLDGSFTEVVNIDVDERFTGYVTVDRNMTADKRILFISNGGITEKKERKVIRELNNKTIEDIVCLFK
ncbi:MAG: electron transfer flavoprotein subunit beta/FixA family protein [Spirochaetaceae bacterium]|nr:electron transfer flavoprotein subunit beta/FixA family protein [Spirochaetaceae bacterium]